MGILTLALSPNCCETTGGSFSYCLSKPFFTCAAVLITNNASSFFLLFFFFLPVHSGHTVLFWKSPMSCSMRMNCRCLLTNGSVRPIATGNTFRRRWGLGNFSFILFGFWFFLVPLSHPQSIWLDAKVYLSTLISSYINLKIKKTVMNMNK